MAGQDYPVYLGPGQTKTLQVSGDFIYCKFVDRPILAWVEDQRVKMEAGDNYRPGQRFASFTVENPDRKNPVSIVLTAGKGSFTRQIVQGEITTVPGLRRADGTFVSDRRGIVEMAILPQYPPEPVTYSDGEKLATADLEVINPDDEFSELGKVLSIWSDGQRVNVLATIQSENKLQRITLNPDLTIADQEKIDEPPYIDSNKEWELATISNGTMFFTDDSNYDEIWYVDPDGNEQSFIAYLSPKPLYLTPHPEGLLITLGDDDANLAQIYGTRSGNWGDLIRTIKRSEVPELGTIDGGTRVMYDPATEQWTIGGSSYDQFGVWDRDFNEVLFITDANWPYFEGVSGNGGSSLNTQGPVIAAGNRVYGVLGLDLTGDTFNKWVIHEETRSLTAHVYRPGCIPLTLRPDAVGSRDTTAAVTAQSRNGTAELSGELVKMAVELYYGRHVPAGVDYLDYVYGFKVEGQNGSVTQIQKQTHSGSFAREKIADDFSASFPATVHVTLIDEIELKSELEM